MTNLILDVWNFEEQLCKVIHVINSNVDFHDPSKLSFVFYVK